jgi:antitoxin component YwqK of YwqJK toxin-antitoxin module
MTRYSNNEVNPVKNGKWKEFNKRAILIAEGIYVDGKKHGTWKEYYDHTGTIMIEEDYHHGVSHGRYISYHPNGQVFSRGEFREGLRQGAFMVYDEHGNLSRKLMFVNDIQIDDTTEISNPDEISCPEKKQESRREKASIDYVLISIVLLFCITAALQVGFPNS